MEEKNLDYYIRLLEANKNLILTGAPGTGKTYLAKAIADKMEAEYELFNSIRRMTTQTLWKVCALLLPIKTETSGLKERTECSRSFARKHSLKHLLLPIKQTSPIIHLKKYLTLPAHFLKKTYLHFMSYTTN